MLNAACKSQDNGRTPLLIRGNPIGDLKLPAGRKKRRDVVTSQEYITLYRQCAYGSTQRRGTFSLSPSPLACDGVTWRGFGAATLT